MSSTAPSSRQRLDSIFTKPPTGAPNTPATTPAAQPSARTVRTTTIYLPRGLGERARSICRNREMTWTDLTIEAINAHAAAIAAALHPQQPSDAGATILPARQPRAGGRRARIPGGRIEMQLRLDAAQLASLDRQVTLAGAMNRSHYVTTALQLHLND